MRKFATLGFSLLIGLSSAFAAPPQEQRVVLDRLNNAPSRPVLPFQPVNPSVGSLASQAYFQQSGSFSNSVTSALLNSNRRRQVSPLSKISPSGASIYGHLMFEKDKNVDYWAEIFLDGTKTQLAPPFNPQFGNRPITAKLEYVRGNVYYLFGYGQEYSAVGDGAYHSVLFTYNFETGESFQTDKLVGVDNPIQNYQLGAYDADNDLVYGYIYDGKEVYFGNAPADDPGNFTRTGVFDQSTLPNGAWNFVAYTFNPVAHRFITFWKSGIVTSSDLKNGNFTEIGDVPVPSTYVTGACYSPYDNGYVFAVCNPSEENVADCSLQLLDASTFNVISSVDYAEPIEYKLLACPDSRVISQSAPQAATFIKSNFPEGALLGSMRYKLASATVEGTPILGNVNYVLRVDGVEVARGTAPAGSEIDVKVPALENGFHKFVMRLGLGDSYGPDDLQKVFIGYDTPQAPESVTLTEKTVSWTAVPGVGVNGGYVNPEETVYNVYINGEKIASNVKGTECPTHFDQNTTLEAFTASVEAVFDQRVSELTYSNDINYGKPVEIPFSILPTEKQSTLFTICNPDGNDSVYFYNGNYVNYPDKFSGFQYFAGYAENNGAYLFLPAINFPDAKTVYEFTGEVFKGNENYEETFEVVLTRTPDPATYVKTLIQDKSIVKIDPEDYSTIVQTADFTVPEAGIYYIGIHFTSHRGERICTSRYTVDVSKNYSGESPNSVGGISAVPGAKGALEATVTFTMPTESLASVPYAADKTLSATAQADGCESVTVTAKPGATVSVVVPTKQGNNTISVYPSDGDAKGVSQSTRIYTGVYVPYIPSNFKATPGADNFTVHLTWNAPTSSTVSGGYVSPTDVNYYLCEQQGRQWVISGFIGKDVFSCDVKLPEGTSQTNATFGVIAENAAGISDQLALAYAVVGKPFEIPFSNDYTQGEQAEPLVNNSMNSFNMFGNPAGFYPQYSTPDNRTALFFFSFANLTNEKFTLPKFSTKDSDHAAIEFYTYGGSSPKFSIAVSAYGLEEPEIIATYTRADFAESGPQKVRVELPAKYQGLAWVEPTVYYDINMMSDPLIIYSYRYIDNLANDFGVSRIAGNSSAHVGEEARFVASVFNYSYEDRVFPGAKWVLTDAEGETIASVDVPAGTEAVSADSSFTNEISFTPGVENIGELLLTYTINPGDQKTVNDTYSVTIPVFVGNTPVVTDLNSTEISYDKVSLAWSEPVGAAVTESLEDEVPFIVDEESDEVGPFTRHDGDGKMTLTVNGLSQQPYAGAPASFVVYSQEEVEKIMGESVFKAHSGDKFLVAFCPGTADAVQPQADDWLISPKVSGNTSVSFFIKPLTYELGAETVEILYSTGNKRVSGFKLLKTIEMKGETAEIPVYQEYSAILPADAKYFAIRYVSRNKGAIFVDDIRYTPADNKADVKQYEVYRNGALAGTTSDNSTSYDDVEVAENSSYSYMVLPVLNDGSKGLNSNVLTVRTTGISGITDGNKAIYAAGGSIIVKGYEGLAIAVSAIDGKLIATSASARQSERFSVEPGIYLVKAGNNLAKLIVK